MIEEIKSIPATFGNRAFYRELVYGSEGIGIGFILILAILGILGAAARQGVTMHETLHNLQAALAVLPNASSVNGKLTLEGENPWSAAIAPRPSGDSNVEVPYKVEIDTDYTFSDNDAVVSRMNRDHLLILITADRIISRTDSGPNIEINNLSSFPAGRITHQDWVAAGESITAWAYPVVILGGSLGIFAILFLAVVVGAVLMKIWAFLVNSELDFSDAMRLVAAAGIPIAIITVFYLPNFGLRPIVWLGWSVFGLWLADRPNKSKS